MRNYCEERTEAKEPLGRAAELGPEDKSKREKRLGREDTIGARGTSLGQKRAWARRRQLSPSTRLSCKLDNVSGWYRGFANRLQRYGRAHDHNVRGRWGWSG